MNDIENIILVSKKYEKILSERFAAEGNGLIEKANFVFNNKPNLIHPKTLEALCYIGKVRNSLVHDEGVNEINDRVLLKEYINYLDEIFSEKEFDDTVLTNKNFLYYNYLYDYVLQLSKRDIYTVAFGNLSFNDIVSYFEKTFHIKLINDENSFEKIDLFIKYCFIIYLSHCINIIHDNENNYLYYTFFPEFIHRKEFKKPFTEKPINHNMIVLYNFLTDFSKGVFNGSEEKYKNIITSFPELKSSLNVKVISGLVKDREVLYIDPLLNDTYQGFSFKPKIKKQRVEMYITSV